MVNKRKGKERIAMWLKSEEVRLIFDYLAMGNYIMVSLIIKDCNERGDLEKI